jgi:ribosome-dependent ATPase
MPNRAETTRTYLGGLTLDYLAKQSMRHARDTALPSTATGSELSALPVNIESRFRYNQSLKSVYSMVPSVIMMMLILIPAIMTALGVVREVETGSIANFRSTPLTSLEFLLGKQVPYLVIGLISFATLIVLALFVFAVPVKGSWLALVVGAVIYLGAATAFGLVVSTLTRTQVAAVFATAILALIPVSQFSGLLVPVSSLSGAGRALGLAFPASWFQQISMGTFNKGLGFSELWFNHLVLAAFVLAFITAASLILRKQES